MVDFPAPMGPVRNNLPGIFIPGRYARMSGYTQVQPNTAWWLDPTVTRDVLFEMDTNLRLGFRYLRMLIDRYGSTRIALLAYNRGPGTVQALIASGEDPANGYATRVLGNDTR